MSGAEWLDLTVLDRKKYNYLTETLDLTRQLAEALDRNDQVSVRMLIAMRQDPIRQLQEVENSFQSRRRSLAEEDQERVGNLLSGEEPQGSEERVFLEQVQKTRRLLKRVLELDRTVSLRMAGENSYYKK